MDEKDFPEEKMEDTVARGSDSGKKKNDDDEYEKVCYVCRRPENVTGPMVSMPGGMNLCHDCMQKAFDSVTQGGFDITKIQNMPYMNLNFSDLGSLDRKDLEIPNKQRVKKKSEKEPGQALNLKDIPAPHVIRRRLDEYVIGQEQAKKVISVAVYNHYKRVYLADSKKGDEEGNVQIEKSNILMIGPTGSGKTYLVKTLAKLLDVPLAIADATSLTEAGYIGDDIESVVSKLLAAADNDVEKAERGIIFIDEIDKIAKKKNTSSRDVSGESVQQELLKLLEGSSVEVPVGSNQKNALTPMTAVSTENILFICGGAFPDLEDIIRERLKEKSSIGFSAELKDRYEKDPNILSHVTNEDLRKFGMIPEFLGRLPISVTLESLDKELLVRVLKEPKNAILKQYKKLLELDEVYLVFEDEALEWIAEEALKKKTGARALRAIIENFMLDIMYEVPKDPNIGSVVITRAYLDKNGGPLIQMRC
ncbi:ATP-dependent Clp protease ATP-binding subunit ClpX [Lacrimispora celerecrescens]|uniref:ATP-dependent Clp protease ATP-binding subunit ClpX n=1 Tax=[Clostridium] celerecrescens 18A TaxID=1286362 RepID=A0A2M8ZBY6_9FIRM|nr:ATP-dependent Clp protease ATP-binding subunit ClpX [Lacrimispora celerecrescens]PJJ30971.1 ATP-dependent Clp protease ATP-binding subunit ClpX [[Clostridium] celerecrescens 18A]